MIKKLIDNDKKREVVIATKYGDTTGNGTDDEISLIELHENNKEHKFTGEVFLRIKNITTGEVFKINLESHLGISYKLYMGKFTSNYKMDVLVQGFNYIVEDENNNYIFSYINRTYIEVFNGHKFLNEYKIESSYKDDYLVEILCKKLNNKYCISIREYDKEWLSQIYDNQGKVKINLKPINTDLNAVYPIGPTWGEEFGVQTELYIYQTLISHDKLKVIAIIQNRLKWKDDRFIVILQNIAVFGKEI